MKILGFEIQRIKKVDAPKQCDEKGIKINNREIKMTWYLLSDEQKIKIANLVLRGTKTGIMGWCGDIEHGVLKEVLEYKNGKFEVKTDNNFYTSVIVNEDEVIEKWNNIK